MKVFKKDVKQIQLIDYNYMEKHEVLTVTEWQNGEGWDISIGDKMIQLHIDEWDALQKAIHLIDLQKGDFNIE